ncbi:MAG TPA: ATP-binding cassette domain-containing protein [Chthonomonadaceae bacterium]|nr:ATP-binding cassette domain-containing protein [Chthonomonadaceae bacterium]
MIELKGVSKRYGDTLALAPTDLSIEAGKTTVLIGPSGCGKSTLLRLMVGLLEPTTGAITFEGAPLTPESALSLRRRMGYVIQDGGLFPHLTAAQNARLMATYLHRPAAEMRARLQELCALTHFPPEGLDRYPVELSGGQRQRVSLMRAIMLDPDVLLLDEPLAALDPLVRASLQTDLKQIFQRLQKTVVLVTHDMAEAGYLADMIVLLMEGHIVQQGTLEDLRERPASRFVSDFLTAQRSLVQL